MWKLFGNRDISLEIQSRDSRLILSFSKLEIGDSRSRDFFRYSESTSIYKQFAKVSDIETILFKQLFTMSKSKV